MDGRLNHSEKPSFFKLLQFQERFQKAPFSCRNSVNGRPNRRNKTSFSHSSSLKSVFTEKAPFSGVTD